MGHREPRTAYARGRNPATSGVLDQLTILPHPEPSITVVIFEEATMDIGGWLRSLGLERYEAAFGENEIDETVLPKSDARDPGGAWRHGSWAPAQASRRHRRATCQ